MSESKFLNPSKSPSLIVSMRFSWTSSFFSVSKMESAFCGIAVRWFPPRFSRFSFLLENSFWDLITSRETFQSTHLSSPRNASGSMLVMRFSYSVRISSVSKPSKARLWMTDILLWFRLRINRWCRFFSALDGTFCNWFCDTSSCVKPLPVCRLRNEQSGICELKIEIFYKVNRTRGGRKFMAFFHSFSCFYFIAPNCVFLTLDKHKAP